MNKTTDSTIAIMAYVLMSVAFALILYIIFSEKEYGALLVFIPLYLVCMYGVYLCDKKIR